MDTNYRKMPWQRNLRKIPATIRTKIQSLRGKPITVGVVTSTINWPIFEAYPGHAFTSFLAASHPAWRRFHP